MSKTHYIIKHNELTVLTKYFQVSEYTPDKASVRIFQNQTIAKRLLKPFTESFDKEECGAIHCFVKMSDLKSVLERCPKFKRTMSYQKALKSKLGVTSLKYTSVKCDNLLKKWHWDENKTKKRTKKAGLVARQGKRNFTVKNIENLRLAAFPANLFFTHTVDLNRGERQVVYHYQVALSDKKELSRFESLRDIGDYCKLNWKRHHLV